MLETNFTEVFEIEHPLIWAACSGSGGRNSSRPWPMRAGWPLLVGRPCARQPPRERGHRDDSPYHRDSRLA